MPSGTPKSSMTFQGVGGYFSTNLQVGAPKVYAVFYVQLFSINPFDYRYYSYRRKFRSQTSDHMDR